MGGPFFLVKAALFFARTGLSLWIRLLGQKKGQRLFWGGMVVAAIVASILQLWGV